MDVFCFFKRGEFFVVVIFLKFFFNVVRKFIEFFKEEGYKVIGVVENMKFCLE